MQTINLHTIILLTINHQVIYIFLQQIFQTISFNIVLIVLTYLKT